ncbi:MAG: hypothetical protein ABF436_11000, partial [Acetobacter okinawensis]
MQQPPLERKPTGRTHTPRHARFAQAARMVALMACGSAITGCEHRDAVDATLEWTRNLRGGVIATQRPPPPGQYDPYPIVGLTPTQAPDVPSPQARALLSEQLARERNLAYRTEAANGTMIPDIPPPPGPTGTGTGKGPGQKTTPPPQPEGGYGAI